MERKTKTLADHFDGGLSPVGVVIALLMVVSGIGGVVALSSDAYWLGIPLTCVFVGLIVALTIAAFRTDPTLRMTHAERAEKWKSVPTFLKASLYILAVGSVVSLAADLALPIGARTFPFLIFGVMLASIVFAYGMKTNKPPIPRPNQEPLTIESSPGAYLKQLRAIVLSSYVTAFLLGAICILFFIK